MNLVGPLPALLGNGRIGPQQHHAARANSFAIVKIFMNPILLLGHGIKSNGWMGTSSMLRVQGHAINNAVKNVKNRPCRKSDKESSRLKVKRLPIHAGHCDHRPEAPVQVSGCPMKMSNVARTMCRPNILANNEWPAHHCGQHNRPLITKIRA